MDDDEISSNLMQFAELTDHWPEVPIPVMQAVAAIVLPDDVEKRTVAGFDFLSALNEFKLVTLLSKYIDSDDDIEFRPGYDDGKPRYSRYGYRLDIKPEDAGNEDGNPIFPTDVWVGFYDFPDNPNADNGIRLILSYEDIPIDKHHPDLIEVWLRPQEGKKIANSIDRLCGLYE